jgi:hypothetical protein
VWHFAQKQQIKLILLFGGSAVGCVQFLVLRVCGNRPDQARRVCRALDWGGAQWDLLTCPSFAGKKCIVLSRSGKFANSTGRKKMAGERTK